MQGVGQLTGPVTGRRVPQDRVKRFGRCSPRASGQRHGQQQQRREPQLGLDPKLPLWRRHLVPLCHSRSACCCFLFRVSPSSGPAPFPAPPASASDSASSSAPPSPAQAAASRPASGTENLSWAGLRTRPTIAAVGAERRPPPSPQRGRLGPVIRRGRERAGGVASCSHDRRAPRRAFWEV